MPPWHHAPLHVFPGPGAYMVTGATLYKRHLFRNREALDLLTSKLLELSAHSGWQLQAWAVFSNHYHFIAHSPESPDSLPELVSRLHSETGEALNALDGTSGRKVWFQYWDTHLSYQRSYFARLRYVHENPVRHGLVREAVDYRWCSARWFEEGAKPSFRRTVQSFRIDQVRVYDEFEPILPGPG